MFIPPKYFSTLVSTFWLLVAVLIPLQACSNIESNPSAVAAIESRPDLSITLYGETNSQAAYIKPRSDDSDSNFVVAASSYMKKVNKNLSERDAREYAAYIKQASEEHGVDKALLLATIKVESRFNRKAVSPDGAKGLTQVIPKYHRAKIAAASKRFNGDIFHPGVNIHVGTLVLLGCMSPKQSLPKVLACYNGSTKPNKYTRLVLTEYRIVKRSVG